MSRCSIGIAALLGIIAFSASGASTQAQSTQGQTVWKFNNLSHIGGLTPKVEGAPQLVDSPVGKAVQFNGKDTGLFFPDRPLVGARPSPLRRSSVPKAATSSNAGCTSPKPIPRPA